MIDSSSDVKSNNIGEGTRIWQFCVVMEGAKIGCKCNICAHVLIENDIAKYCGVLYKKVNGLVETQNVY